MLHFSQKVVSPSVHWKQSGFGHGTHLFYGGPSSYPSEHVDLHSESLFKKRPSLHFVQSVGEVSHSKQVESHG